MNNVLTHLICAFRIPSTRIPVSAYACAFCLLVFAILRRGASTSSIFVSSYVYLYFVSARLCSSSINIMSGRPSRFCSAKLASESTTTVQFRLAVQRASRSRRAVNICAVHITHSGRGKGPPSIVTVTIKTHRSYYNKPVVIVDRDDERFARHQKRIWSGGKFSSAIRSITILELMLDH